jgi:hypothetical protein
MVLLEHGRKTEQLCRASAARISLMTRYYDEVIQVLPVEHDRGTLLGMIDCPKKAWKETLSEGPADGVSGLQKT